MLGAIAGTVKVIISALSDRQLYSGRWVAVLGHAMVSSAVVIPVFVLCFVWVLSAGGQWAASRTDESYEK